MTLISLILEELKILILYFKLPRLTRADTNIIAERAHQILLEIMDLYPSYHKSIDNAICSIEVIINKYERIHFNLQEHPNHNTITHYQNLSHDFNKYIKILEQDMDSNTDTDSDYDSDDYADDETETETRTTTTTTYNIHPSYIN